jgi:pectate lyase
MEKNKRKINYVILFLALTTLLYSASCKKESNPGADSVAAAAAESSFASSNSSGTINLTGLRSDGGYAYHINYPLPVSGDSNTSPTSSTMHLYENGVELGPAHSVHQDIRDYGKGRFSHWGTTLYFSASDNTNPATNGRVYTYTMGTTSSTSTTAPAGTTTTPPATTTTATGSASATTTGVSSALMGYAMYNGTTTGGAGGTTVTVSSLADLKAAVSGSDAKIVYVSGAIQGSGDDPVYVSSNKSIIGKPGASITGVSLYLFTVNNIIIQNITFRNYVTDAAIMMKFSTTHVWVDHCDFATDRNHGWAYWGKDITITRASDFITVSWSRFHDTNLSFLISGGLDNTEDIGHLHVTLHHNFWYNVSEREPDMNYGRVHMFDNYHLNNGGYSLGARANGIIRTDNEYFSGCAKPLSTNLAGDPPGYFSGVNTNVYQNCGANDITTALSTWVPEYSYSSVLDAAANVPAIVQKSSGAILNN